MCYRIELDVSGMTETAHPEPAPSPHAGVSRNATVVAADTSEWDGHILTTLLREFIRAALWQPAVADFVGEHLFDGDEPPAGAGDALRLAIVEVLGSTTPDAWDQAASDLLAYVRECMEDDAPAASPPTAPVEGWAPPPGFLARQGWSPARSLLRQPFTRRKPPVRVEPSEILAWLTNRGSATTRQIAQHFNISESAAWGNTNVLVHRGEVDVMPGGPHSPRIYSIRRPTDADLCGDQLARAGAS